MATFCELPFLDDIVCAIWRPRLALLRHLAHVKADRVPGELAALGPRTTRQKSQNFIMAPQTLAGPLLRRRRNADPRSVLEVGRRDLDLELLHVSARGTDGQELSECALTNCGLPHQDTEAIEILDAISDRGFRFEFRAGSSVSRAKIRIASMRKLAGSQWFSGTDPPGLTGQAQVTRLLR